MDKLEGAPEPKLVSMKLVSRQGPLALVQHPNGDRFWLVLCPHCNADLSRVSHGRIIPTPQGNIPDVTWPGRCPECGGGLWPAPSLLTIPPGARLGPT